MTSRALVLWALCSFILAVPALAGGANMLYIAGPNWPGTNLKAIASSGPSTLRTSDCGSFSQFNVDLPAGGVELVEGFSASLCSPPVMLGDGTAIGVAKLPIEAGTPDLSTEAVYLDPSGTLNVVAIPSLPDPLEVTIDGGERYVFNGLESGTDALTGMAKITNVALVTDDGRDAFVSIALYDERNKPMTNDDGTPVVIRRHVQGFDFVELTTPFRVANAVVTNEAVIISPATSTSKVYAVAFSGFRSGSPVAIVPKLELSQ